MEIAKAMDGRVNDAREDWVEIELPRKSGDVYITFYPEHFQAVKMAPDAFK